MSEVRERRIRLAEITVSKLNDFCKIQYFSLWRVFEQDPLILATAPQVKSYQENSYH